MDELNILPVINSDDIVNTLLIQWGLPELISDFEQKGIDIEVLKELSASDIDNLIPVEKFGLRIKFRKRLFGWKEINGFYTPQASTETVNSSNTNSQLEYWLNTLPTTITTADVDNENKLNLDLSTLLLKTVIGKSIVDNYKIKKILSTNDRNFVTTTIVDFWINQNIKLSENEYLNAVEEIKKNFPTENEKTYLNSKTQRGKLAEKYYSQTKKYRRAGLMKSRYNLKKQKTDDISSRSSSSSNVEEENEITANDFEWLKNNNSPLELVYEKWNSTFSLRRKDFLDTSIDVYAKWPILKQQIATSLIELDFNKIYPQKNVLLFSKWSTLADKIVEIFKREIKDKKCKILLSSLESPTINEDSKNYIISINLNAILIPKLIKNLNKKTYRPSILDAQNSFAVHLTDKSYIQTFFVNRKSEYELRNWKVQPTIVVIGETIEALKEFYIYVNDILYEVESYLKALSVTFQLHHVLNLEYEPQCIQAWQFFERYIYKLPINSTISTSLNALISELEM